ncbi:hypothetical protein PLESTB_001730300 [Pleodorina starrii]|uniref:Uncharacterized protein n=1 Tax=Pleodorina starrii TaxID=330485 RepID=A0A9W6F9D5_9CHLO|nr:hypothetical protein PLESTM_000732500 [Pleodorina starrii]GLC61199.1 hypothetical protein PLESTB_001730300 [Pleodorina starrii]GLC75735.1 hypothetical protein PLESTF_001679700 [Pleodorina starrii]
MATRVQGMAEGRSCKHVAMLGSNSFWPSVLLIRALVLAAFLRSVKGDGFRDVTQRFGRQGSKDNSAAAYSLLSCYNAHYNPYPINFEEFLGGKISKSFRLHRVWWSKKQAKYPLGLFTHLSLNRVDMLEAQCRSYPGGLVVAAVWVPLLRTPEELAALGATQGQGHQGHPPQRRTLNLSATHQAALREATAVLGSLFRHMEFPDADGVGDGAGAGGFTDDGAGGDGAAGTCALRILLVYEMVGSEQLTVLMPVNQLRNTAMLAVDTPMAAMVDADLSLSWSLAGAVMADAARAADLLRRAKKDRTGWVIPAWDIDKRIEFSERGPVADQMLAVRPESKRELAEMWHSKHVILPFAFDRYKLGHNGTQYDRWFNDIREEYPIAFEEGYEPWFFAYRKHLALYDVRFRGHYYDKISNVRNTVRNQVLTLRVMPDVWLVHRPHAVSMQNNLFSQMTGKVSPMDKPAVVNGSSVNPRDVYLTAAQGFYGTVVDAMNHNRFEPLLSPPVTHCRQVLPWWKEEDSGGADADADAQGWAGGAAATAVAGGH